MTKDPLIGRRVRLKLIDGRGRPRLGGAIWTIVKTSGEWFRLRFLETTVSMRRCDFVITEQTKGDIADPTADLHQLPPFGKTWSDAA